MAEPLKIDQSQALAHLSSLGYIEGDDVYTRAFFPNSNPASKTDKGRKASTLDFNQLEAWQNEGRGIYFVVNGGGHSNDDVVMCRAIFYEHDNLSKELQKKLWQDLKLPEPSLQVDTGGKSIHSYWVFDKPLDTALWKILQTDLLDFSNGDRAIKNPSRVMRLAGGWHIHFGSKPVQSSIILNTGKKYSYEELRSFIPAKETSSFPRTGNSNQYTEIDYARSYLRVLAPWRCEVYQEWIEIGMALHSVGASILLQDWINWSRGASNFVNGECEKKWATFKIGGIKLGSLGERAKTDGWHGFADKRDEKTSNRNNEGRQSNGHSNAYGGMERDNVIRHPRYIPISIEEINKRLDDLIQQGLTESDKYIWLAVLSKEWGIFEGTLSKIYHEKIRYLEQSEERHLLESELNSLLDASSVGITLEKILPSGLAYPLSQMASLLALQPECYLTALLCAVSTLHPVGTKLKLINKTDFEITPNLFGAIVAEPSQKKSPIFSCVVAKPFNVLRNNSTDTYAAEMGTFQTNYAIWMGLKPADRLKTFPDGEPVAPKRKIYSFTRTTDEGLVAQVTAHPKKALLWQSEELSALLKSGNQYRGGRGGDIEYLLEYYDGSGATILRASGIKAELENLVLGIIGTIQPEVLGSMLADCSDTNGKWARFIFIFQEASASILDEEDSESLNITSLLADLYSKIEQYVEQQYTLSPEAKKVFINHYNKLEQRRVDEPHQGMRAVWGKVAGRIGKIAINLHLIEAAFYNQKPEIEITKATTLSAIRLARFYVAEVQRLYYSHSDTIAPALARIVTLSWKQGGWINASYVLSMMRHRHQTAEKVREWFRELVAMDKGENRGAGRNLEFKAFEKENKVEVQKPTEVPPPQDEIPYVNAEPIPQRNNATIQVNQRVKLNIPGSARNGCIGIVKAIEGTFAKIWIEDDSLPHSFRDIKISIHKTGNWFLEVV